MKNLLITILILITYSNGSGQIDCSGPLGITVAGSHTGEPLQIDHIAYDIFCRSLDEGAIELSVSGGSPDYKCIWDNGADTDNVYNLKPGMYTVTITDSEDCVDTLAIAIEVINPIEHELVFLDEEGCGECYLTDGVFSYFFYDTKYMIYIQDVADGTELGNVEVCTRLHEETYLVNGYSSLNRSWCLESQGGTAELNLFFSNEELEILADEVADEEIRSTELEVLGFVTDPNGKDTTLVITDLSMTYFDDVEQVWYLGFVLDSLPENICFYITYKGPDAATSVNEDITLIEHADFRLLANPVVDQLQLQVTNMPKSQLARMRITNDIGQEVFVRPRMDIITGIYDFDVSAYSASIYFLTVEFPETRMSKTFKFVKVDL